MKIGTKLEYGDSADWTVKGEIVSSEDTRFTKRPVIPGDICIIWDNGQQSTYDNSWIEKYCNETK